MYPRCPVRPQPRFHYPDTADRSAHAPTDNCLTTTRQACTGISRATCFSKRWYTLCGWAFASAKGADEALQKKEEWKKKSGTRVEHQGTRTKKQAQSVKSFSKQQSFRTNFECLRRAHILICTAFLGRARFEI